MKAPNPLDVVFAVADMHESALRNAKRCADCGAMLSSKRAIRCMRCAKSFDRCIESDAYIANTVLHWPDAPNHLIQLKRDELRLRRLAQELKQAAKERVSNE